MLTPEDDSTELKEAQEKAAQAGLLANLGQAASNIGYSIAGVKNPNPDAYAPLQQVAKAPVQNLLEQKKFAEQEAENKRQAQLRDPNSLQSKIVQSLLKKNSPGIPDEYLKGVTAADSDIVNKPEEVFAKIQANKDIAEERKTAKEEAAKEKRDQALEKQNEKKEKDYGDAYQKAVHDLNTFRGNQAVQQAATGILAADKALAMLKGKDLDNLNTKQIALFNGELAKIATGGVPTEHGLVQLMPDNVQTRIADMKAFFGSNPTPAEAGAYLKQNLDYLKDVRQTSEDTLKNYQRGMLNGYKYKLKPEHLKELQDEYLNKPLAASSAPQSNNGLTPVSAQAGEVARKTKDGKIAIFDAGTKKFLRYQE